MASSMGTFKDVNALKELIISHGYHAKVAFPSPSTTTNKILVDRGPPGFINQRLNNTLDNTLFTPFSPHIINYKPSRGLWC
ncbi:hypothetical protein CK203_000029 [Vitis vinifera]|uniref:Uncharacterized protein n=1 Tax=Vitis vinifera TaxID=29760 RepID=A0A438KRC2_VITVI|nr:hypothetical protein CK203_000029 [Vitis vinifera]